MSSKFVVAFGPNQSYYFCNRQRALWNNVPEGLGTILKSNPQFSPEKMTWLSLGPNSSYFVRSTEAWGCANISPAIENRIATLGGWKSVQWIQFTHDPDVYLILDTNGQLFSRGLGEDFHDAILRYAFHGFKDICLGLHGGFALSTNNNMVSFTGMPEEFSQSWKSGDVLQVTTSPFDRFYFIEFKDGGSVYVCPNGWHGAIDELRNAVPKVSAASALPGVSGMHQSLEASRMHQAQENARHQMVMAAIGSMGTRKKHGYGHDLFYND